MSKLMGLTALKNGVSRNGFDLGRKNCFTAKVGELLPVMVEECIPGDKFKIKTEWFTRTMPVNSAAYTRIREYYDFFFVPTRLLWRFFPNFVTQMDNNSSAPALPSSGAPELLNSKFGKYQPYILSGGLMSVYQNLNNNDVPLKDILGFNSDLQFLKLSQYLGYRLSGFTNLTVQLNPFPYMAYQKIWYDYYRNSQWEQSSPSIYNCDYILGDSSTAANLASKYLPSLTVQQQADDSMFTLRYCNWQKDMFMGILPSPQFGDTATAAVNLKSMMLQYPTVETVASTAVGNVSTQKTTVSGSPTGLKVGTTNQVSRFGGTVFSADNTLSILALRQSQALQKWKEISLSGNQDYKTQIEKHFGVKVSDTLSDMCKYIGGTVGTLDIGEVVNTNLMDGDYEANIQGKGVGGSQGFVDFECHEHGYLMCIYHALPLLDYDVYGVPQLNLKTSPTDYAIPEFDKIGMQPLKTMTLLAFGDNTQKFMSGTLGYVPRYVEYKTHVDEIHGAFCQSIGGNLTQWVAPLTQDYLKSVMTNEGAIKDYRFFKCNPSVLDSIFTIKANKDGGGYNTDNLLINCHFDVKAVRNLDYDGLPY